MSYAIRTEHLGKTYPGRWFGLSRGCTALKDLTIEVPEGVIFGFLGPNGAGKTTTIKLLLSLLRPSRGTATIFGKAPDDPDIRRGTSYVPEQPSLHDHTTPRDFLILLGKLSGLPRDTLSDRVAAALAEMGLKGKEDVACGTLSKGLKQRVELAQAILTEPRLLILDEPLSGLDPIGRREIREVIRAYHQRTHATIFFCSHVLTEVELLCDWIGIIDRGELKTIGMLEELLPVEGIEISGTGVRPEGQVFLEKMGDYCVRKDDRFSLFLKPGSQTERAEALFRKYGSDDVTVKKHCRSLEQFFMQTVDQGNAMPGESSG